MCWGRLTSSFTSRRSITLSVLPSQHFSDFSNKFWGKTFGSVFRARSLLNYLNQEWLYRTYCLKDLYIGKFTRTTTLRLNRKLSTFRDCFPHLKGRDRNPGGDTDTVVSGTGRRVLTYPWSLEVLRVLWFRTFVPYKLMKEFHNLDFFSFNRVLHLLFVGLSYPPVLLRNLLFDGTSL